MQDIIRRSKDPEAAIASSLSGVGWYISQMSLLDLVFCMKSNSAI